MEGVLWLKEDGKKSWKKRYFLLRASGIYYVPKGKAKVSCFSKNQFAVKLFSFLFHTLNDWHEHFHTLADCYTMALFLTDIKTHFLIWSQRVQYVWTSEGVWPRHVCKITFI